MRLDHTLCTYAFSPSWCSSVLELHVFGDFSFVPSIALAWLIWLHGWIEMYIICVDEPRIECSLIVCTYAIFFCKSEFPVMFFRRCMCKGNHEEKMLFMPMRICEIGLIFTTCVFWGDNSYNFNYGI